MPPASDSAEFLSVQSCRKFCSANLKHLLIASLTFVLVNGGIELPIGSDAIGSYLEVQGGRAWAQSGGRARGGSFDRPSVPQSAPDYPSSGGYSSPYDYSVPQGGYYSQPDYPGSYRRPTVIVPPQTYPVPVGGYGYGTSSDGTFLILVLFLGITLMPMIMNYLRASSSSQKVGTEELNNDIVTVTALQIALLAQAHDLQAALTQMSLQANLENQQELTEFLRETVLALLRSPENWTHARVSSQTANSREQASQLFEQLSIQERSKLTAETLVNVGGKVRRQNIQVNQEADPASYIIVTLLIGTADDRPIATAVHSVAELTAILKRLGGISTNYLLIFELIWSPQDASDSLSRDQLLFHYPELIQIT